jgi:ferrous iron transport protein A
MENESVKADRRYIEVNETRRENAVGEEAARKHLRRLQPGEKAHLSDLRRGQSGLVTGVHNDNAALRRRLLDMGMTKGVVVTVKKIAPLGDPIDIELRGYELCIRKSDMANIDIEVIS